MTQTGNIYKMKLHDIICLKSDTHALPFNTVIRVAGGWIYCYWESTKQEYDNVTQFVPFDNEFMEGKKNIADDYGEWVVAGDDDNKKIYCEVCKNKEERNE